MIKIQDRKEVVEYNLTYYYDSGGFEEIEEVLEEKSVYYYYIVTQAVRMEETEVQ
jgi:hypothetical protein